MKKLFIIFISIIILAVGVYYLSFSGNQNQPTNTVVSQNVFNGSQLQNTNKQAVPQSRSMMRTRSS